MPALSLMVLLLPFAPAALGGATAEIGRPAPGFVLNDQDGRLRRPIGGKGRIVVLEWFNPACAASRKYYAAAEMQSLQERYRARGVDWYVISSTARGKAGYMSADRARSVRAFYEIRAPILLDPDGEVGHLYGAMFTPTLFVVDSRGALVYAAGVDRIRPAEEIGRKPRRTILIARALDALLSGGRARQPDSWTPGCAIEFEPKR